MNLSSYVGALDVRYRSGIAREHSYRGDLQNLLQAAVPSVLVTNEPARIACGAPDYILTQKSTGIDIGYIEAKDIGKSLVDKAYDEQFMRYRKSLSNIIFTDYLEFRLFRNGEFASSVRIAEIKGGRIVPLAENFDHFLTFIREFSSHTGQTITTASVLSSMMAGKAKLLAQVIESALTSDVQNEENTSLKEQMEAFRGILIHDIDEKAFSDLYAQTIAYGMFAARLHDLTPETFTRQEAAQLIPQTNPFLRKLFQYISGYDIDSRIEWIVNALADVFRATNLPLILKDFGRSTQRNDPMIHFYESFLSEYDPALRRSRGVWYTPEPVVKFIVGAVDDVLKGDFALPLGLADTSQIKVKIDTQTINSRTKKIAQEEKQAHKVQILDPATGTGTFLAEVLKHIHKRFTGQKGIWSSYVEEHLIPRLNGFELLMASYAVAHLKLDLLLQETGYKPRNAQRLHVYLTNSLEEHHPDTGTLFASWLSKEANEANYIKRDTPVMVVLGNPPYSRHSMNKGHWLSKLLEAYKKEPGSNTKLRERNSKWLNDDYVKFVRYAQHFIDKTGYGVVGYITNHGYIDNPTFRGMRWSLLKSFNKIFVIDLHGNSNIVEAVPEGSVNENVFDIKQGVAIIVAIRSKPMGKNDVAAVKHIDVYGAREEKYAFLEKNSISTIDFEDVVLQEPYYYFKNKRYQYANQYSKWPSIGQIYKEYSTGYYTSCDEIVIGDSAEELRSKVSGAGLNINFDPTKIRQTTFRPFDIKYIYYDDKVLTRARAKFVARLPPENIFIISGKSTKNHTADHFYIGNVFPELKCGESSKGSYMFPLWINETPDGNGFLADDSNINPEVMELYREVAGDEATPFRVHMYIYAVMYSPSFRAIFDENLKEDFIHIPYPTNTTSFRALSEKGEALLRLHTLSDSALDTLVTTFPLEGTNRVSRAIGKGDWEVDEDNSTVRVWINDEQYFEGIPVEAWELSVGGYLPAQKWLKDRKARELSFHEIIQYQHIIVALVETVRIMDEIDDVMADLLNSMEQ